jgi:hypothetical protein
MKTLICYIILMVGLISCKEKPVNEIALNQPMSISLDTTLSFFPIVKKYIQERKYKDNANKFLLVLYNDESTLRIKITAAEGQIAFSPNLPSYYFRYKDNLMLIFTGVDKISELDPDYIRFIKGEFYPESKTIIYDPPCWEIVYNEDTCYYFNSPCPFAPPILQNYIKFKGPN